MQLERFRRRAFRGETSGFSLMETIGILAVASILAAAIVPTFIARIDRLAAEDEEETLVEFSDVLKDYINAERILPGDDLVALGDVAPESGALSNAISERSGMRLEDIRFNDRGNARIFLCDPSFWEGIDISFPLQMSVAGWSKPENPRMIILSSNGAALPSSGYDFEALWMAEDGSEISESAPWNDWVGNWEDIKIQRVHLGRLFHRVILNNLEAGVGAGYKIDGLGDGLGGPMAVPGLPLDAHYLEGAKLELYSQGELVASEIITSDRTYYYEDGIWRSSTLDGGSDSAWVEDICDDIRNWVEAYGYDEDLVDVMTTSEIFDIGADYCATLEVE